MAGTERYMLNGKVVSWRCPVCGSWIHLQKAKNGKPHGFCKSCGLQVFFRQPLSIEILEEAARHGVGDVRLEPISRKEDRDEGEEVTA